MNIFNKKRFAIITLGAILPVTGAMADYFVKEVKIYTTGPNPTLTVKSDGKKYTHVEDNGTKTFHASATGVCTNMAHVAWASYALLSTPEYKSMHNALAENVLDVSGKWHKTFGHNRSVSVKWKPNSSVKQRAVEACNSYLNDALKQNPSLYSVLSKQHSMVIPSGIYGNFGLRCDGNLGTSTNTIRKSAMQPMEVICDSANIPKPARAKSFRINSVSLKPVVPVYNGSCPADFKFQAAINGSDIKGNIRYRFKNHFGGISPWKTKTLDGTYVFLHTIKLQDIKPNNQPAMPNKLQSKQGNGMGQIPQLGGLQQNPWVTLEVEDLASHKTYMHKASYKYTCTQAPKFHASLVTDSGNSQDSGQPDLIVLTDTFRLGSKTATNNSLVIGANEASKKLGGKCRFRSLVKIKNQGQGDANELFGTRIRRNNVTLLIDNLSGLKQGQSRSVSGNLMLPPGKSTLLIKTDHANKVDESNEGNNLARIMVTVTGNCGSHTPPRPGSSNGKPPRSTAPTGAPARPIQ